MSHATSGSVTMLASIIVKWLQGHRQHLSASEFSQVATVVRESGRKEDLFRTKRAAIDFKASYPDPQCRISELVRIKVAGGALNGTEQTGKYCVWNPANGRTTIELPGGTYATGFFLARVSGKGEDSKAA